MQDVQIPTADPCVDEDQEEDKAFHSSVAAPVVDELGAEAAQVATAGPSVQAKTQVEVVQVQVPAAAPCAVEAEATVVPAAEFTTPEAGEDIAVHRAAGDFSPKLLSRPRLPVCCDTSRTTITCSSSSISGDTSDTTSGTCGSEHTSSTASSSSDTSGSGVTSITS